MKKPIQLLGFVLLFVACAIFVFINRQDRKFSEPNTVAGIAYTYHVSADKVKQVAAAFGITNTLGIASYGEDKFPVSYIETYLKRRFGVTGPASKADIDGFMRGYEARCEVEPWLVYYIFYSTNLKPTVWRPNTPRAMVLGFAYQEDPTLQDSWILSYWWGPVQTSTDAGINHYNSQLQTCISAAQASTNAQVY